MNPFIKSKKQLSIFITAGYPKLESLPKQLELLENEGVDFIEVGIPFSDPMADGRVIQETSTVALNNGMNLDILFEQLSSRSTSVPIVLMGYLNPVIAYGMERFLENCESVGVASVILPDMSVEIYERFYQKQFENYGITPAFLITPTTNPERVQHIAKLCVRSFVYLVSSNATTGGLSNFNQEQFSKMKSLCGTTPLFVGFGIKTKDDVQKVQSCVDGAIIGSAYLKAVAKNEELDFLRKINPMPSYQQ
ncbi:MAG: tryptophan synthase subunit alpha [Crocinitomicaceae bacterium]|nr:tryptophan synthase subunit alpha [Crocinitomicaceae bacterium]